MLLGRAIQSTIFAMDSFFYFQDLLFPFHHVGRSTINTGVVDKNYHFSTRQLKTKTYEFCTLATFSTLTLFQLSILQRFPISRSCEKCFLISAGRSAATPQIHILAHFKIKCSTCSTLFVAHSCDQIPFDAH